MLGRYLLRHEGLATSWPAPVPSHLPDLACWERCAPRWASAGVLGDERRPADRARDGLRRRRGASLRDGARGPGHDRLLGHPAGSAPGRHRPHQGRAPYAVRPDGESLLGRRSHQVLAAFSTAKVRAGELDRGGEQRGRAAAGGARRPITARRSANWRLWPRSRVACAPPGPGRRRLPCWAPPPTSPRAAPPRPHRGGSAGCTVIAGVLAIHERRASVRRAPPRRAPGAHPALVGDGGGSPLAWYSPGVDGAAAPLSRFYTCGAAGGRRLAAEGLIQKWATILGSVAMRHHQRRHGRRDLRGSPAHAAWGSTAIRRQVGGYTAGLTS